MRIAGFKNLKITYRILIGFQFMMIPAIMIFIVLFFMLHKVQDINRTILIKNLTSINAAYNVENALLNLKELRANYILDGNRKWLKEFDESVVVFNFWYNKAFEVANTDDEKDILSDMSLEFSHYLEAHKDILYLVQKGKRDQAVHLLLVKSMGHFNAIHHDCVQLIASNNSIISDSEKKLREYSSNSLYLSYAIIFCFIVLGVILVYLISKSIVEPIEEMVNASERVFPVDTDKTEIASLKQRFEMMIEAIKANQQKLIISERRAAVGEIAAGISHELNNPIGVICGFTELLLKRKEITESDREFINDINNEAQRCKKLLGQMLDFARTPAPRYIETDIKGLLNETIRLFNSEKFRGVRISFIAPDDSPLILADAVQIRQVLFNLILNSCEAMNCYGDVDINLSYTESAAEILISDTGPGIGEDVMGRIFTPFFTTKAGGVGLGLAVCSDLIEKHNGSITAKNKNSRGAEFFISLPIGGL